MKPTFALNLSNERVGLLHRTGRGWLQVGEVAFDTPDLSEALDYLRKTALGLSPRGVSTKLVIPNSEILYCDVEAPGPDDETRRTQIRAGLAGRTPYAPEDLVFDWRGKGTMVKVAVVARQTLAEAEAFAVEHRFGPVSFVALPEASQFKGEPFFGQTEAAKTILTKGETVEPDRDAMTIVTRDLPLADVTSEPQERPAKRSDRNEKNNSDPIAGAVERLRTSAQAEVVVPQPEPDMSPIVAEVAPAEPVTASLSATAENSVAPSPAAKVSEAEPWPAPEKPATVAMAVIDEAPFAEIVDTPSLDDKAGADILDDVPPAPSPAAQMAFASRRAPDDSSRAKSVSDLPGAARLDAAKRSVPPLRSDAQVTAPSIPGSKKRKAGPSTPPPAVAAAAAALATSGAATGKTTKPLTRPGGTFGAKPLPQRGKPRYLGLILTGILLVALALIAAWSSYSLVQADRESTVDTAALAPTNAPADAAPVDDNKVAADQQDTGISSDSAEAGSALDAVPGQTAIQAPDVIVSAEDEAAADGEAAVVAEDLAAIAEDVAPEPRPESLGDTDVSATDTPAVDPVVAPDSTVSNETAVATVPSPSTAEPDLTVAGSEGTPTPDAPAPTAEALPATTETVVAVTPEPEPATAAPDLGLASNAAGPEPRASDVPADEIFLATADTAPSFQDALKLPDPAFPPDPLPAAAPPPPPFGTVYKFDAAGLIVPTPEGILSPEGFMLFAGTPPLTPPARSAAAVAAAAAIELPASTPDANAESIAATAAASLAAPIVTPEAALPADPALAGFRPRPRPEGLTVPASAESADDASLAPEIDARFANLRPRARPETAVVAGSTASSDAAASPRARPETLVAGSTARNATAAASLTAQANAAVEAAVASAAETGNIMTLAVSRRPAARPQDMSRAVNAAVAAAVRAPEPEPEATEVATDTAALPEDDAEPELASAAPKIPTKTTVAKQATFANAINLSRVNLIGVYGTPSKRYALIRLTTGRYKKVSVGDSFDGGRVEAITASEVRYQKGGRLVSLKMPRA